MRRADDRRRPREIILPSPRRRVNDLSSTSSALCLSSAPRQQCGARHISQSDTEGGDRDESALRRASPHGEKNLAAAIVPRKAPTPTIVLLTMMAAALAAMAALKNENLPTPLPGGCKRGFHEANARENIVEYVPKDENVEDWPRMVAAQIFYGAKNIDPDAFAQNLGKNWISAGAGGGARKVTAGAENGYPFSLWMYDCALNPATQKPETMWLKATSGADSLYSVQYAALSTELIGPATDYLKRVSLCDARRADRPCPEGM
jgi:hypothetical protein